MDAAAAIHAVGRALDELPVGKVVDYQVVQMVDVVLGIYPLDQISSFQRDRTAGGAYSTGPDSDSLALAVGRTVEHYHYRKQVMEQT